MFQLVRFGFVAILVGAFFACGNGGQDDDVSYNCDADDESFTAHVVILDKPVVIKDQPGGVLNSYSLATCLKGSSLLQQQQDLFDALDQLTVQLESYGPFETVMQLNDWIASTLREILKIKASPVESLLFDKQRGANGFILALGFGLGATQTPTQQVY